MKRIAFAAVLLSLSTSAVFLSANVLARSGGGGHSSSSSHYSPGTGSSHSSTSVRGYTRKDGTYVAPHQRSKPDGDFKNNWSTKGNQNPYTGKEGTRQSPPQRP
jgi:hypothetical protein